MLQYSGTDLIGQFWLLIT